MQGMFLATRAKLVELKAIRIVTTILLGSVITFFAVITLERNDRANIFLLGSHSNLPTFYIIP